MKDIPIYVGKVILVMAGKTWLLWGLVTGLLAVILWLLPANLYEQWKEHNHVVIWLVDNGKWLGLSIFGVVVVFVAPFLAWREEYHKLKDLTGTDAELERRKRELEVEALENNKMNIQPYGLDANKK